jgi:hypothetical protein
LFIFRLGPEDGFEPVEIGFRKVVDATSVLERKSFLKLDRAKNILFVILLIG